MWTITELGGSALNSGYKLYMSDGLPIESISGVKTGESVRLTIVRSPSTGDSEGSYIDITDMGMPPGSMTNVIFFNTNSYFYNSKASVKLTVSDTAVHITGDNNDFVCVPIKYPSICAEDIRLIREMEHECKLMPYQELHRGERPWNSAHLSNSKAANDRFNELYVETLADTLFPWTQYAYELAFSIYDWTTANFFRLNIVNLFRRTQMQDEPLNKVDIVDAIWTANYPPYNPSDVPFMHSMLMEPAKSREDVDVQYDKVHLELLRYLDALKRVTSVAIAAMPRTCIKAKPKLYSGQVDISLPTCIFPVFFEEYPGNKSSTPEKMGMPLKDALSTFMNKSQVVTLKAFMAFTDSQEDAINYSSGILVEMSPAPLTNNSTGTWRQCAFVSKLSNELYKTEYLFTPGSKFLMGDHSLIQANGKEYTLIRMSEVDETHENGVGVTQNGHVD